MPWGGDHDDDACGVWEAMTMRQWIAFAFTIPLMLCAVVVCAQFFRLALKDAGTFERIAWASIALACLGMFILAM